ncbi:hypothetical protein Tco_1099069 [Tanacetum coccineum]
MRCVCCLGKLSGGGGKVCPWGCLGLQDKGEEANPPSPTPHIPDSIPEVSGGNHGGQSSSDKSLSENEGDMTLQSVYDLCISLCTQVTDQAKEIKHLKAHIKKLKKQAKPVITHHKAWMKSVSLKQRLAGKKSLKSNWMQKEFVSKQGRKFAKAEPSVHKDLLFDELDDDEINNMDTEDAQDVGRTRNGVNAEKEGTEDAVSTEDVVSTDKEKVSIDISKVSTDKSKDSTDMEEEGTDKDKDSTVSLDEGTDDRTEARSATPITSTTTSTMFGDDETIAQVLLNMSQAKAVSREKEKGVELKDVEETERPRPTSTRSLLTLKPLPKIDLKDKGKKKIEEEDESDTESEDIPEAEKKKRLAEEEATKTGLSDEYDFIQARIEADRLLALRLQDEERGPFQLLGINDGLIWKLWENKKHSDLKSKTFEEIQALYEKVKRFDESFTAVGSTEDERRIKEMNEGVKDTDQKRLKEEDTAQVPAKVEVTEQGTKKRKGGHIKMIARKKPRKQSDVDSDDEHRKCLRIVAFEGTIDSEIMEKKSFIVRLNKISSLDGDYLVIYRANGKIGTSFNYLIEVLHIFDRQDLYHLYNLMLEQYSETTLEGIELILWGDLKIMMESSTEENDQSDFWSNQQDWKIITWRLYEACGVCILEFEDGTVIHMLREWKISFFQGSYCKNA